MAPAYYVMFGVASAWWRPSCADRAHDSLDHRIGPLFQASSWRIHDSCRSSLDAETCPPLAPAFIAPVRGHAVLANWCISRVRICTSGRPSWSATTVCSER